MANSKSQKSAQKRYDSKRAGKRARAWTAVVYPESAIDGWIDILSEQQVQAMVSPLHDMDVEPNGTGESKKAHYHVVIQFTSPATYEKACEIFEVIGAVAPPEDACKVKDLKQMARYLCHLDQPNKHRYNTSDVRTFGGIEYQAFVLTESDEESIIDEIEDFITTHKIISFMTFMRVCRELHPEWKHIVRNSKAYYVREYIRSNAWHAQNKGLIEEIEADIFGERIEGKTYGIDD